MNEWYVINDLQEFTNKTRAIVYNNFGSWSSKTDENIKDPDFLIQDSEKDEFDRLLSYSESLVIVKELLKKQKHKSTKKIRYILNDSIFAEIVKNLNERIVSNIINSLSQKGLIESAFDSELNDFVFWVKDANQQEKPETD